jgi:tRNA A-37 threonylcarbamoyl transferase component Bud32
MSNTTSSAVPESFHGLITTLGAFKKNSGSTSSVNNMSAAFASIPHENFPPTKLLQHAVRQRLADVIEAYKDSFNQHKHLITNFPTIQSRKRKGQPGSGEGEKSVGERSNIRPFVKDILLELLPKMIPDLLDRYDIKYEELTDTLESAPKKLREIPDFGIHIRESNPLLQRSFLTCVFPVECKNYSNLRDAMGQSVHYLIKRVLYQIEFNRTYDVNMMAFCIGCDGWNIVLGCLSIRNNEPFLWCQQSARADTVLLPEGNTDYTDVELKDIPGLASLIALLTAEPNIVGIDKSCSVSIPSVVVKDIAGMGAFSTAFFADYFDSSNPAAEWNSTTSLHTSIRSNPPKSYAGSSTSSRILSIASGLPIIVKFPVFTRVFPGSRAVGILDIQNEVVVLQALATDHASSPNIPRVVHYDATFSCSLLVPAGKSMEDFIAEDVRDKKHRILLAKVVSQGLREALKFAHHAGFTHRDVRPQNVVMKDISGDFVPVLIDWGLAGVKDKKHPVTNIMHYFQHRTVVEASLSLKIYRSFNTRTAEEKDEVAPPEEITYEDEYDYASVRYVEAAIVEYRPRFEPSWMLFGGKCGEREAEVNRILNN